MIKILNKLGTNHTYPCVVTINNRPLGVYTFKNSVYVLKDGDDIEFNELSLSDQSQIVDNIISDNYVVYPSFQ